MCVEGGAVRRRDFNIFTCLLLDFLQSFSDDEGGSERDESVNVVAVNNASLVEVFGDELKKRFIEDGEFSADFIEAFFTHFIFRKHTDACSGLWR